MANRFLSSLGLTLQLFRLRMGWALIVVVALFACAAGIYWLALPDLLQRTEATRRARAGLQQGHLLSTENRQLHERYEAFRTRLGESAGRGELLKALFAEAARAGIALSQGDYQRLSDTDGGYQKQQLTLPVRGAYPQIRKFVDTVLEKLPAASLDEISFRRDNVRSPVIEARLKLTIYLKDAD